MTPRSTQAWSQAFTLHRDLARQSAAGARLPSVLSSPLSSTRSGTGVAVRVHPFGLIWGYLLGIACSLALGVSGPVPRV